MGKGPAVLCLHGFPDSPATFRSLLPRLADAGFRGIAPVLRGYEPSSQPADGDYGIRALVDDVEALMGALDLADVHLIGHDWGASIAVAAACRLGGRIRSLSLLAVPHPVPFAAALTADLRQLQRSWYMFFFQIPGLSEYVVRRDDFAFLEHLWRSWSPGFEPPEAVLAEMRRVFAEPGVVEASLGYYRAALGARGGAPDPYSPPVMAPTLGLCGAQDGCIGADIFLNCLPAELFPGGVRGECIAGAGHFLHLEAAEAVETRLRDHLARHR